MLTATATILSDVVILSLVSPGYSWGVSAAGWRYYRVLGSSFIGLKERKTEQAEQSLNTLFFDERKNNAKVGSMRPFVRMDRRDLGGIVLSLGVQLTRGDVVVVDGKDRRVPEAKMGN